MAQYRAPIGGVTHHRPRSLRSGRVDNPQVRFLKLRPCRFHREIETRSVSEGYHLETFFSPISRPSRRKSQLQRVRSAVRVFRGPPLPFPVPTAYDQEMAIQPGIINEVRPGVGAVQQDGFARAVGKVTQILGMNAEGPLDLCGPPWSMRAPLVYAGNDWPLPGKSDESVVLVLA